MSTEDNTRVSADGDRPVIGVSWKWFALLCLTGGYGDDRLELLVVPPDTPAAVAARAMTLAAGRGNRSTATDTLRAARNPPWCRRGRGLGRAPSATRRPGDGPDRRLGVGRGTAPPEVIFACVFRHPPLINRDPIGWERSTCQQSTCGRGPIG